VCVSRLPLLAAPSSTLFQFLADGDVASPSLLVSPPWASSLMEVKTTGCVDVPLEISVPLTAKVAE